MSQQPKRQNRRSNRRHIPALDKDKLEIALQTLDKINLSPAGKKMIAESIKAAANPGSENIDTVLLTLTPERQEVIKAAAGEITKHQSRITRRAAKGLSEISDSEWDALVNEANSG